MENLGIALITCGIAAVAVGFIFMTDEDLKLLRAPGAILFILGLFSAYVGLAIQITLWMLIIVPIVVILLCLPENNYS